MPSEFEVVHYRVYKLSPGGRIMSGEWIEADNEDEAVSMAHAMCDEASPQVELWQGTTRVATLPCNDPPPASAAG